MKVLKFGGSSVASAERIEQVDAIIRKAKEENDRVLVVVSAFGGVTDLLIDTAELAKIRDPQYEEKLKEIEGRHFEVIDALIDDGEKDHVIEAFQSNLRGLRNVLKGIYLLKELSKRTLDQVMAFGELSSAFIISKSLKADARFLDARKLVRTDSNFGFAQVDFEKTNANIRKFIDENPDLFITTGFIAYNDQNETTTLGRGGSDFTVAIFGAALGVEAIEIWSDVDGVLTADPRKVRRAISLHSISYEEAMEMSHFGAKIIYPPTLQPAIGKNIPIYIRNTFNPDFSGTLISESPEETDKIVKGISSIDNIALVKVQGSGMIGVAGISARLFRAMSANGINIILITQASSEHSICFAIRPAQAEKARRAIEEEFELELRAHQIDEVIIEPDLSILAIVGENMRRVPGVAGKFFEALGKNGINVVAAAQGSSELNLSVVIDTADLKKALNVVHEAFFLSDAKVVNLFMIGVGLIGKTLISQVQRQADYLKESQNLELRFVALANSKKMVFNDQGIPSDSWEGTLNTSEEQMSFQAFVDKMAKYNLRNSIFLDCTANEELINYYPQVLKHSISIATPNKIANSISFENYQSLKYLANKYNVRYEYETTVGAGLPVITTLRDLMNSGDRVIKIEAVLSGTLSYIFNSYDGSEPFSAIVKQAKERGFTEPDPRNDLNGKDVARKILILARESGLQLEPEQIEIESLVSNEGESAPDVDSFFQVLATEDETFKSKIEAARGSGKVLRYMASLENEEIEIGLKEVDSTHPFYGLSGSDNMIVFTTERYKERPLVVKGPGAGAEVTAAGVFAEVISISNYLAGD